MRMIIACLAAILAFVQEDKPGKRQATEKIVQMTIFAAVRPRPTNTGESAMTVPPKMEITAWTFSVAREMAIFWPRGRRWGTSR